MQFKKDFDLILEQLEEPPVQQSAPKRRRRRPRRRTPIQPSEPDPIGDASRSVYKTAMDVNDKIDQAGTAVSDKFGDASRAAYKKMLGADRLAKKAGSSLVNGIGELAYNLTDKDKLIRGAKKTGRGIKKVKSGIGKTIGGVQRAGEWVADKAEDITDATVTGDGKFAKFNRGVSKGLLHGVISPLTLATLGTTPNQIKKLMKGVTTGEGITPKTAAQKNREARWDQGKGKQRGVGIKSQKLLMSYVAMGNSRVSVPANFGNVDVKGKISLHDFAESYNDDPQRQAAFIAIALDVYQTNDFNSIANFTVDEFINKHNTFVKDFRRKQGRDPAFNAKRVPINRVPKDKGDGPIDPDDLNPDDF